MSAGRRRTGAARFTLIGLWLAFAAFALYTTFESRLWLHDELARAASASLWIAATFYLAAGCLRGLTLIPSTTLVLIALPFFPPAPLFALTLVGIVVSSASLYRLAHTTGGDDALERRHGSRLARLRRLLDRYEFPVIVAWSFFPLAPTDLICYACGVLRLKFWRAIAGVALGEGAISALYIFGGDAALRWLHWKT